MRLVSELWRRVRHLAGRSRFESELDEELQFHLEQRTRENEETGMSPEEARWAARRQIGNATLLAEDSRQAWLWPWLEALVRDLRLGARLLGRNPGFTAVATLTLALGLGANLAIFTVLYNVVLRPLGYPDPDRLVSVFLQEGANPIEVWSWPKYQDLRQHARSFEGLAAWAQIEATLGDIDVPERLRLEMASASYFSLLGIQAQRGRVFTPEEDATPGGHAVILVSDGLWRRVFGGAPGLVGRQIRVQGTLFTVAGVLPQGFRGETGETDLWTPMAMASVLRGPHAFRSRGAHWFRVIGRLRPGVTRQQADQDVRAAVARMEREHPSQGPTPASWSGGAKLLKDTKVDPALSRSLTVLLAATGLVLLIGCVNLANLLLGRALSRSREVAVRLALGAGRASLIRQFVAEGLLLSGAGCGAGLLLAWWALQGLERIRPTGGDGTWANHISAVDPAALRIEAPAVLFGLLLALGTALFMGLLPAWSATRPDVQSALKSGGPAGSGPGLLRLRGALAAGQIALALVLLTGAGLMIRSFAALLATRLGVETHQVLTLRISIPRGRDEQRFFTELRNRAAALPGVEAAAIADTVPMFGHMNITLFEVDGRPGTLERGGTHNVSPEYFPLFRVPLLAGRTLEAADRKDSPAVAVINQAAARTIFGGRDPVGRQIGHPFEQGKKVQVVGVVGDIRHESPDQPVIPEVYFPAAQEMAGDFLAVRTAGNAASLAVALRLEVRQLERGAAIHDVRTMEDRVEIATSRQRFSAVLLGAFSALALVLAAVGVYGVFSYAVSARMRELGIRAAMGARRSDIAGLILRGAAGTLVAGLALGIPCAIAATRLLRTLLYGVEPGDFWSHAAAALLLSAVALAASWIPARRAAKADPLMVLRSE